MSESNNGAGQEVRIGIVGVGNMGSDHASRIINGEIPRTRLTAVCDYNQSKLDKYPDQKQFTCSDEMINSGEIDAILIATPHYDHTTIGIAALKAGLHVLVEKPISVHKADCERLIKAYDERPDKGQIFAAMFNQRTDRYYTKVRDLITSGELGEIRRVNWIITNWFRTYSYYASGGWRATWGGEGGGVLLNQCPHQIDLYQWLFGMPSKVRGFCQISRYHEIEVEDDVTAYFEYPNGKTGVFITSTGESPGTNRLEITAERGRIVIENDKIMWTRNCVEMTEHSKTTESGFVGPETWEINIPAHGHGDQHLGIIKNFVEAILDGTELIAPAVEGIHSVELANAILYSSFIGQTIEMPLDSTAYEVHLKKLIEESTFEKKVDETAATADFSQSFGN